MILVKYRIIYFFLFLFLIFINSCQRNNDRAIISGNTMGTTYTITIDNFHDNKNNFKDSIDEKLNELNLIFSTYIINSEIANISKYHSK